MMNFARVLLILLLLSGCGSPVEKQTASERPDARGQLGVDLPKANEVDDATRSLMLQLVNAKSVTVCRIHPTKNSFRLDEPQQTDTIHDHEVLQRTTVGSPSTTQAEQEGTLQAFLATLSSDKSNGKMCFIPRHAIQYEYAEKRYVVMICFECQRVVLWQGQAHILDCYLTSSDAHTLNSLFNNQPQGKSK